MASKHKNNLGSLLFVAPSAYPLGGVAIWLRYVLHGLSDQGFVVHLGLLSGHFHKPSEYLAKHRFDTNKVDVVSIKAQSGSREGRVASIVQTIEKLDVDIVVSVNAPDTFEAGNRVKTRYKPSLKVVMTLHGLEVDYFLDIQAHQEQIDAVIATNRLTCLMIEEWANFPPQQILYAPYGVEIPIKDALEKKQCKEVSAPLTILYAGRIEQEQKRINDLISLVIELEKNNFSYHLLLAGSGNQADVVVAELKNQVIEGRLTYLGDLSHAELFEKGYAVADVLVLLSDWETGPIVIWEAMAHGIAVVSSQYKGSVAEGALIHDENTLLFPIGDFQTAANAVMNLNDKILRQRLVKNAYDLVLSRYSRERSIKQWVAVMTMTMENIDAKPATDWRQSWQKQGRIERLLGYELGNKVRRLTRKSVLINDAGSEWPHSLSRVSDEIDQSFRQALNEVEGIDV